MQDTLCSREVSERLGVSLRTLTTWRRKGILVPEVIYPTNRFRYTEQQIKEFESSICKSNRKEI